MFISSCTPEAAAWLDAGPGENGGAMPNADYDTAYKLRLGVPLFKPTDQCPDCHVPVGIHGDHAFSCPKLQGQRTNRHTAFQEGVSIPLREVAKLGIHLYTNKPMNGWYEHTAAGRTGGGPLRNRPVDLRMDIGVEDHNDGPAARYIVDFTITHVTEQHLSLREAAKAKEDEKHKKYTSNYRIPQPDKYLVPWAVEWPGAWGPRAHKFVHLLLEWRSKYGSATHLDNMAFTRRLRERTAVAVQSANAAAIRLLRVRLAGGGAAPSQ